MNLQIRPEQAADIAAIEAVTIAAFANAPHSSHNEQRIVAALRAAQQLVLSLVAEVAGEVVGHVALSPVQISDGSIGWYGLGPVSVLPAWHGRGIGSELIRQALAWLNQQQAAGCVVLGEPAYYQRFDFTAEPSLSLPGVPAEYFMAQRFSGPMAHGIVRYHQAFES